MRDLDTNGLRARWKTILRREALPHLSRHLLFRVLAYRLQADAWGDLDKASKRRFELRQTVELAESLINKRSLGRSTVEHGTILAREWDGRMHRVAALADGFAWNGKTYRSLSQAAFAITGTRWNGPRFFGLRDKQKQPSSTVLERQK